MNEPVRNQARILLRDDPFDDLETPTDDELSQTGELSDSLPQSPEELTSTPVETQQAQLEATLGQSLTLTARPKQRSVNFNPIGLAGETHESYLESPRVPMSRVERTLLSSSTPPSSVQQLNAARQLEALARQSASLRLHGARHQSDSSQSIKRRLLPKQPAQTGSRLSFAAHQSHLYQQQPMGADEQLGATSTVSPESDDQALAFRAHHSHYIVGRGSLGSGQLNQVDYNTRATQLVAGLNYVPIFGPLGQRATSEYPSGSGYNPMLQQRDADRLLTADDNRERLDSFVSLPGRQSCVDISFDSR